MTEKRRKEPRVNIADAKLKSIGNGEIFVADASRLAPKIGMTGLGCSLVVVPPGKRAYPFHKHHVTDELFYIISGTGKNRHGEASFEVRAGDVIAAPAGGEAHQLVNTGSEPLRYLAISTIPTSDILEYPDTGKVAYAAGVKDADLQSASIMGLGHLEPADYYEKEPAK